MNLSRAHMLQEKENRWATPVRRKTEEQMWVLRLLLLSDTTEILNKMGIIRKDE